MTTVRDWSIAKVVDIETNLYTTDELHDFFYDWFCSDKALTNKSKKLLGNLRSIVRENRMGVRFDPEQTRVFFKNNCPGLGNLYDDFRICERSDAGDVIYTVVPASGVRIHSGKSEVWGKHPSVNNGEFACLVYGDWEDVKRFFRGSDQVVAESQIDLAYEEACRENRQFDIAAREAQWQKEYQERQYRREHPEVEAIERWAAIGYDMSGSN